MSRSPLAVLAATLAVAVNIGSVAPSPYLTAGPSVKTGKSQVHGRPGTRPKAERNARKAKRRQRAKARR